MLFARARPDRATLLLMQMLTELKQTVSGSVS
jgi:hypothetical protein